MAGESPLLTRVRAAAARLDDDALAALANKGLLRRAKIDLRSNPPKLIEPAEDKVCFHVENCTVEMAEITTHSRCSCPATGTCRHILTAILFLRETATSDAPASQASPNMVGDEVMAVTDEALLKWAGKALVRKATQALATGEQVEIEEAGILVIRFPLWNVTCRWVPGSDLSGMICGCHSSGPCMHRVAAVLAFQVAKGGRQIADDEGTLEASTGAPRSREEVLASVRDVLRDMVSLGLSRLSDSTEARLRTLTVSAHGVDLPRLERLLHSLADEVALSLRRDARAASASLLSTASRIEALRSALANPTADLVGVHRSRYEKIGDIDLVGMGARQWRTRSGYAGLTVYFWDRSLNNWATWSESRPVGVTGFDPASRYDQDGPWSGCDSPAQASRHVIRLMTTWRNRAGRLSGRPATHCLITTETNASEMPPAITSWADLGPRAGRLFGGGLHDRNEQDEIVFLRPQNWGQARFDPIRQELVQPIFDSTGHALLLITPNTPQTANAISILEQHDAAKTRGLVGLLRLRPDQLAVEPVTIHGDQSINLTLDGLPSAKMGTQPQATDNEAVDDDEADLGTEPEPETVASTSPLGILLARAAEALEAIAEGGVRSARHIDRLRAMSSQCGSLGLVSIARPIVRLADELDQLRKSTGADPSITAGSLMRAYYIVSLARAQEIVAGATATIRG